MKIESLIIVFVFILTSSCRNKTNEDTLHTNNKINKENMFNNQNVKSILIKQIEAGNDEVYGSFSDYNKDDLDALVIVADSILKSHGYKIPDTKNFNFIIKEVFGRIIDDQSKNSYLKVNNDNKCDKDLTYYPYSVDAQFLYVVKGKFITNFYPLPRIIDYLKQFPDVAQYEKDDIIIDDKIEENKTRASQWKDDLQYLAQVRNTNIQILINRNKYLFNNSKASLVWLKFYDKEFLESLVKTFGYVKDEDLLKWVLDKNLIKIADEDLQEFGKILWTKTCDNNIIVHKEVFDFIAKQDKTTFKNYNLSLRVFAEDFKDDNLSFSEVAKIKALVCYYGTKMTDDNLFSYFFNVRDQKYEEEFKKNNYYNLPDFKEIYELTRKGGISLPGEIE